MKYYMKVCIYVDDYYMSMHGLNNLINNNVQLQRLDDINNNDNINNNVGHRRLDDINNNDNIYTYLHVIFHQQVIHIIDHQYVHVAIHQSSYS